MDETINGPIVNTRRYIYFEIMGTTHGTDAAIARREPVAVGG